MSARGGAEDWEQRRLCPDGGCVGVLSEGGVCSVCGKAAPGGADAASRPTRAPDDVADDADADDDHAEADRGDTGSTASATHDAAPDDWDRRQLCSDGACIGVVVAGRCTTCGTAARVP